MTALHSGYLNRKDQSQLRHINHRCFRHLLSLWKVRHLAAEKWQKYLTLSTARV